MRTVGDRCSTGCEPAMMHSYPEQLVGVLLEHWDATSSSSHYWGDSQDLPSDPLPDLVTLEELISTCYQASLLKDEGRQVRFRLILSNLDRFIAAEGPPLGLHRVQFTRPRPFNQHELRRLSPALDFYRTLIGVGEMGQGRLQIWGLLNSGPRWIQTIQGGRLRPQLLPETLILRVTGPGRISVCKGLVTIATLTGGKVVRQSMDVLDSNWLPKSFSETRAELASLYNSQREQVRKPWAILDYSFVKLIAQQVMRRVISLMRNMNHGGTLILVPYELTSEFDSENRYIAIKYRFAEEEPRRRLRTLILGLMYALAEEYGKKGGASKTVGWNEYSASKDETVLRLDEGMFEMAHLVAHLSAADGAVVMNKRFEILGFGAEILGKLEEVKTVARALDAEGDRTERESTDGVGTRHRSAYRLCNELHEVIVIVVSQDGTVRFIKWKDGIVTYWDQVATSVLDL